MSDRTRSMTVPQAEAGQRTLSPGVTPASRVKHAVPGVETDSSFNGWAGTPTRRSRRYPKQRELASLDRLTLAVASGKIGSARCRPGIRYDGGWAAEHDLMLAEVRWRPDPIFMMDVAESAG